MTLFTFFHSTLYLAENKWTTDEQQCDPTPEYKSRVTSHCPIKDQPTASPRSLLAPDFQHLPLSTEGDNKSMKIQQG